MRNRGAISVLLTLALVAGLPVQAAPKTATVSWRDLAAMVSGKKIGLTLPDGTTIQGKVMSVSNESLTVDVAKSSNRTAHPKGEMAVPRTAVKSFTMQKMGFVWQTVGTAIGLTLGLAAGLFVNAYAHNEGDGAPLVVTGLIAGPALLGYFAGRSSDRHTVTVTVID